MLNIANIKQIDYEVETSTMIIHLKHSEVVNGINTNIAKFNMDYKTYLQYVDKWRKYIN